MKRRSLLWLSGALFCGLLLALGFDSWNQPSLPIAISNPSKAPDLQTPALKPFASAANVMPPKMTLVGVVRDNINSDYSSALIQIESGSALLYHVDSALAKDFQLTRVHQDSITISDGKTEHIIQMNSAAATLVKSAADFPVAVQAGPTASNLSVLTSGFIKNDTPIESVTHEVVVGRNAVFLNAIQKRLNNSP